jgi:hypothetical protein
MHSQAGAWERGKKLKREKEKDKMRAMYEQGTV